MKAKLKLDCPMCGKEFTTNHQEKKWCDVGCRTKYADISNGIKINKHKQELFRNNSFTYDFANDKFYLTSLIK
tara:strand:+ start:124 stop:342 length:219 start_codon:yes stop_codon:yes gene_type:complete